MSKSRKYIQQQTEPKQRKSAVERTTYSPGNWTFIVQRLYIEHLKINANSGFNAWKVVKL